MTGIRPQINDLRRPNRGLDSTGQLDGTRVGAVVTIYDRSAAVQPLDRRSARPRAEKKGLAKEDIYAVTIWVEHVAATPRYAPSRPGQ
jgi:hypothetical protein